MIRTALFLACLLASLGTGWAGDQVREHDIAVQLETSSRVGRAVKISVGSQAFLGFYTDAEKTDNRNVALILHDTDEHPDQEFVVHQLRSLLPQHNWASLSIQLPMREHGANQADYYPLFDEAKSRIEAAGEYLRQNQAETIVIIGYGLGGLMGLYTVNSQPEGWSALVTISLAIPESNLSQLQIGEFLKNIALPLLDVYAESDLPSVVDSARQRRLMAKQNPVYRQIRLDNEDHSFKNDPELLVKRVYSWLNLIHKQQ